MNAAGTSERRQIPLKAGREIETREDRQDKVREKIATLLLYLLVGEIAGIDAIFIFAEMAQRIGQSFNRSNLKDLIGLVLTPTITLVALGFYFGAKAEASKNET